MVHQQIICYLVPYSYVQDDSMIYENDKVDLKSMTFNYNKT